MEIEFENVNENRVHTTTGPKVQFDISDAGTAAVRVVLTIGEGNHVTYPSKSGSNVRAVRTLETGIVHFGSIVVAAHALDSGERRSYDTTVAINGVPVVRAKGSIANDVDRESDIEMFQLRVK